MKKLFRHWIQIFLEACAFRQHTGLLYTGLDCYHHSMGHRYPQEVTVASKICMVMTILKHLSFSAPPLAHMINFCSLIKQMFFMQPTVSQGPSKLKKNVNLIHLIHRVYSFVSVSILVDKKIFLSVIITVWHRHTT